MASARLKGMDPVLPPLLSLCVSLTLGVFALGAAWQALTSRGSVLALLGYTVGAALPWALGPSYAVCGWSLLAAFVGVLLGGRD